MSGSEYEGNAWWYRNVLGIPKALCPEPPRLVEVRVAGVL